MGKTKNYSALKMVPLVLVVLLTVATSTDAQECSSPTLTFGGQFPVGAEISVTVGAGYTLAQHEVSNIRSVTVKATATDLPVYIVAQITNGRLTLVTNDQFANYERLDDKLVFFNVVVFTCESGAVREMTFRQSIKEENNHAPLFSRELYDIKVPLPLPREFNIQQFVDNSAGIVAYDYDITKNKVTFSIDENDYFTVTSSSGASRTEFLASLITKQTLTKIQPPITLRITAQDEWVPARTSTATLTISGDPVIVFIAPPEFEQSLYKTSYKLGDNFTPFSVNLVAGTYDSTVGYDLFGEDAQYFTISSTTDRSSAAVALRSGIQIDEERKLLSVSISATRTGAENVGRTALVVELTADPKIVPTFETSIYSGTIDRNRVITLDTIRLVPSSSDSSVRVQLSGDDSRYFTPSFSNNQVSIVPSTALTDTVLRAKSYFLVIVQAEKPDIGIGETLVVLSVEGADGKEPHFEKQVYEGTITESGLLEVPTVRIATDSFEQGLEFSYSGDISLVTISSDTTGTITILANNVTPEKLTDKSYLLLTVVAKRDNSEVANAVIVIKVLRNPVVLPKFTSPFLEGQLIEKTLEVRLPNVEFLPESFSSDTMVSVTDDLYFFDIQEYFPANVFKLYLRGNVTREMLRGIERIPLTVVAKSPNSEDVYCVVTVDVIHTTPLVFERLIYDGTVDETKQLMEAVEVKLTAESTDETVQFTLEGADVAYFLLEPLVSATEGVRIRLKEPLSDQEYDARVHFELNLRATKQLATSDALVPIVIYVKKSNVKIPKFEKPLYKSRVNVDLALVPFEQIILQPGSYIETTTVAIRNSNSDLFGAKLQDGVVTIELLRGLDEASVNAVDRFEFIVECTNADMASGFTTVLVDIERTVTPEFTELFYVGEVDEDGKEIMFVKPISLNPQTIVTGTEYTIGGADGELVRYTVSTDQSLKFFLRDEITIDQLKKRSEIVFIVVANNPRNTRSSVASCSVKIVRESKPNFLRSSFRGIIVEGEPVVDFGDGQIAWDTETVQEATSFTIVDSVPSNYFEVALTEDRNTAIISLRSGIRWDQVRSNVYYQLVLEASSPRSESSQCTLVIDVENLPSVTPVFSKSIYRGSLREGTKEVIFSAADTITVQAGTIMPTFQYAASEGDANLFDVTLVDENKFRVSLRDGIAPNAIEGRDMLSFIMTINNAYSADDTATIVITVKLDDIIVPTFSKLLYNGSIVEGTNELVLQEAILLNAGTFTDNTELGIGGTDGTLFTVYRTGSLVELRFDGSSISGSDLASKRHLSFYIQATNPGSDAATAFVVVDIETIHQPRFIQTNTHGRIEIGSREVLFVEGSELRIELSSTDPGYQWNLAGEDYALFDGLLVDDLFKFNLKDSVTDEQLGTKAQFKFSVTLKNPNSDTIESPILISRILPTPRFSQAIYSGSFDTDFRLTLPTIELTEGSFPTGTLVTVDDSNVDFLSVVQNGRSVTLEISRSLSTADFQGLEMVRLVLVASASEDTRGMCSIVLTVPEGTPCIPLPPVVDCSSCYDCTTGGVQDDVPVFPYGNFRFQLRSDTIGPIGSVTATVKDPSGVVEHRLDVTDAYLNSCISITSEGTLSIDQSIVPNVYQFLVHATNTVAGKQTSANVLLDVLNQHECTVGEKKDTVEQVLLVQHLEEEKPHATIFPTQMNPSCTFDLISESPTATNQQSYFYINPETNWLSARSFDREDAALFAGMMVPQFRVVLKLNCNNDDVPNETDDRTLVKRSLVDTNTINYAPDITIVSIIVDDINDNDPVFTWPERSEHLGFPGPSLASKLMLSGLIDVEATDADEGLNAKIRYSLGENNHFIIDAETGSIYPARDALSESNTIELTVMATDRDGATDGRRSSLALTVHRLEEDHVAFVTLTSVEETTSEDVIERINLQQNFHLKVLRQAYVPEVERSSVRSNSSGSGARQTFDFKRAIRLVVYALNDNNQLLNTDTIRNTIRNAIPSIDNKAIVSFNDAVCNSDDSSIDPSCPSCPEEMTNQSSSNTGLIASTSVLGALLLVSLAICSVLYVRYVRPLAKTTNSNPSDIVELENDFDLTPPPTPPTLGGKKETGAVDPENVQDRKISINISGITIQESEDTTMDNKRLARSLAERLEEEDEYGTVRHETASPVEMVSEPKNVKFNEIVERIEVQEHHSEGEDDESVYEERL